MTVRCATDGEGKAVPASASASLGVSDDVVQAQIFGLLELRQAGATLCPSEVARALVADEAGWRALMPQIRQVAQSLARSGALRVTRGGVPVDATQPGGPIRLGRPSKPAAP
ncbi:MAG: DUF3253 domain-containing protein [Comamonadaceae bacterium]|nr:MAG: DUF3253 domain-containing protein [Comamonadaceae bacterium]